jgi:hypothetical protein
MNATAASAARIAANEIRGEEKKARLAGKDLEVRYWDPRSE